MRDEQKMWLRRVVIGGLLGMAVGYFAVGVLLSPGLFLGGAFQGEFTLYVRNTLPDMFGSFLALILWFCFGAEIAVATMPFAESSGALLLRSLLHFAAMLATVAGWVWLNFDMAEVPTFLIPLGMLYALIWLGRWVGWYAEVGEIRAKLGLVDRPSPLKWRETLPHMAFAALLCLVLPLVLRLCDAADLPVLSILYGWLLLPVGGFVSGASLGRRQGFCPLYPMACVGCTMLFILLARLFSNMADGFLAWAALIAPLLGNLAGWGMKQAKERRRDEKTNSFDR